MAVLAAQSDLVNPERWARVQRVFEEALAQPAALRAAFVRSACGDESEVLDQVTALLEAHEDGAEPTEVPSLWMDGLLREDAPRFAPADRVANRYQIRRLLGRGGMGEVYEAWDEELSIELALKTLHLAGASEESRRRLQLEGLLARSVWHPNVCRVYDLGCHRGDDEDVWFLTMEILRGETLDALLRNTGALPVDRAVALALQMAAGIGAAHRAGVVHRDFKPANVLLIPREGSEDAVVTDFGIAQMQSIAAEPASSSDAPGAIIGTPAYMAPEQIRGEPAGPATDIYAMGIVLYEMLTGAVPFSDLDPIAGAMRRISEPVARPRLARPEIDVHLESAVLRCLERDPADRFSRAEDLVAALTGERTVGVSEAARAHGGAHGLPPERDALVGRASELAELERTLDGGARLVTLMGPGGIGKTRLAVRLGWENIARWPGGVWFCDLSEARDEGAIAFALARSLGLELRRGDPMEQLGHAIAARGACLLILDNFEQLVEHAATTIGRWLARSNDARFLVTSRVRLGLEGAENVLVAESLPPDAGFELFKLRARRLRPDFACDEVEADSVREIVRLVDGMPLAIELAAARIRVMPPAQIVQQMRRRFSLLTGGASVRHETLAGVIDGSWDLLTPWERSAWAQFSAFEGGFTLEAGEAVLAFEQPGAPAVASLIQALVDKSLLRASAPDLWTQKDSSPLRFGMLVGLQEYARIRLRDAWPGDPDSTRASLESESATFERHAAWFARLSEANAPIALVNQGADAWRALEADVPNLIQAVRRSTARGNGRIATTNFGGVAAVLVRTGPTQSVVELGHEVLLRSELDDVTRGLLLLAHGRAEVHAGATADAASHLELALALFRASGSRAGECTVLAVLTHLLYVQGKQHGARVHAEAGLKLAREIGARRVEGSIFGSLFEIEYAAGQPEEARRNGQQALAIAREVGDLLSETSSLINLGTIEFDEANLEATAHCFESALELARKGGHRTPQGVALSNLAHLCQSRGLLDEALSRFEEALQIHREVGYRRYEGSVLNELGNLHRERQDLDRARACLEAALVIHRESGNPMLEGTALGDLGTVHFACGRLADARACYMAALSIDRETESPLLEGIMLHRIGAAELSEGRLAEAHAALTESESILRSFGDLFEVAKLLCTRADLELATGDRVSASNTFAEAEKLVIKTRTGVNTELGRALAALRARIVPSPDHPE